MRAVDLYLAQQHPYDLVALGMVAGWIIVLGLMMWAERPRRSTETRPGSKPICRYCGERCDRSNPWARDARGAAHHLGCWILRGEP